MSHTPGPWTFREWTLYGAVPNCGNNGERYIMADDRRVALVDSQIERKRGKNATPFDAPDAERDANARLIAAAPTLYVALQALVNAYEREETSPLIQKYWADCHAALAKAKDPT